jgi:hypothetical protein
MQLFAAKLLASKGLISHSCVPSFKVAACHSKARLPAQRTPKSLRARCSIQPMQISNACPLADEAYKARADLYLPLKDAGAAGATGARSAAAGRGAVGDAATGPGAVATGPQVTGVDAATCSAGRGAALPVAPSLSRCADSGSMPASA